MDNAYPTYGAPDTTEQSSYPVNWNEVNASATPYANPPSTSQGFQKTQLINPNTPQNEPASIRDRIYASGKQGNYNSPQEYMADVYKFATQAVKERGLSPSSPQGQQLLNAAVEKYRTQASDFVHVPKWEKVGDRLVDTSRATSAGQGVILTDPEDRQLEEQHAGGLESARVKAAKAAEDENALNHAKLYADHTVGPITADSTPDQIKAYKEIYDQALTSTSAEGKAIQSQKVQDAIEEDRKVKAKQDAEFKQQQIDTQKRHQDLRESIAAAREPWSDEAKHAARRYDATLSGIQHERMAVEARRAKDGIPKDDPDYVAQMAAFEAEENRVEAKQAALEASQKQGAKDVLPKSRSEATDAQDWLKANPETPENKATRDKVINTLKTKYGIQP